MLSCTQASINVLGMGELRLALGHSLNEFMGEAGCERQGTFWLKASFQFLFSKEELLPVQVFFFLPRNYLVRHMDTWKAACFLLIYPLVGSLASLKQTDFFLLIEDLWSFLGILI